MSAITNALFLAATARAAFQGFNYGNVFTDGRLKEQSDFEAEFKTAQGLEGTNGAFNSARLYTMIQGDSDDVIEAIPAAIETKTSLLLGLWASAGSEAFDKELAALEKAISQHGDDLGSLVAGISVGSEDLYRNSPVGIEAGEFAGTDPDILVDYIDKVRDVLKDTPLSKAKVGHVDTWTAFANNSNSALIEACDWLGMDAYPYFEDTHPNAVSNGGSLFRDALRKTQGAAGDKEVWITETGWPVSGKTVGSAEPSIENAEKFWKDVGCPMFGETNVWWYTLQDAAPDTPNPSFGIVEETGGEPLYDLSCEGVSKDDGNDDDSSASEDDAGSSDSSGNGDDSDDSESGSGSEDSSGDSGADSESGSNSGNTDADSSETDDAEEDDEGISGSHQLNSIGASVVAILGAMALL